MYRVRMAIFLSFACLISLFSQTTYYVSSSQGNDANSGTSENTSWRTISIVNTKSFLPGDKILFKRGDKWAEGIELIISNSGTENNRITYGAYGTGTKPIISMERIITGTWTDQGSNIWRKTVSGFNGTPRKLWLDEVSVKAVGVGNEVIGSTGYWHVTPNITDLSQVTTLSSEYRFRAGNGYIDLYSVGEPSATYSSIKIAYEQLIILIQNKNYITIQDIKVARCYRPIEILGSSHILLDSVDVYDTYSSGLHVDKSNGRKSNYLEIKNCDFNSGIGDVEGVAYEYYFAQGNFAITLGSGDYAKIHNNTFKNFHHTNGLVMGSSDAFTIDSSETNYNEFYDNVMDMGDVNFGRAFTIGGSAVRCHDNRIYRNKIIHNNLNIELGGYHNYFYYNIIHNDTSRGQYDESEFITLDWLSLSGFPGSTNTDNYCFNNTFYTCKNSVVVDFGKRNSMFNNLFINYNINQWLNKTLDLMTSKGGAIYQNNKFYSPYVNHSSPEVWYNNTSYTISAWNSADAGGDDISGNAVLGSNPIKNTSTFEVFGEVVVDGGIDISNHVPVGFKDREGNTVNRSQPNIGAIDNFAQASTGLQINLQGAYTNVIMKTALREGGLIPKAQPYNISPWNYNGNEFIQTVPSEIVDWVLIELRSDISSSSIAAKRAAFIRSDGSIVDLDGRNKLRFDGIGNGNYYVIIRHRNHLSVMSAGQVPLSESSLNYNFTTSHSSAFGNDLADLGNGKYGMYTGDGDADGTVNVLDYGMVGNYLFQTGYLQGDHDLNGTVNVLDYGKTNQNLFKVSNVP